MIVHKDKHQGDQGSILITIDKEESIGAGLIRHHQITMMIINAKELGHLFTQLTKHQMVVEGVILREEIIMRIEEEGEVDRHDLTDNQEDIIRDMIEEVEEDQVIFLHHFKDMDINNNNVEDMECSNRNPDIKVLEINHIIKIKEEAITLITIEE